MQLPAHRKSDEISLSVNASHRTETTVIVGGGSIGLCTAYNLARSSFNAPQQVRIIVIEPYHKPFAASSSNCTGCFHYGFPEKESQRLLPLGKYSFDLWAAQAESEEFKKTTGYRAHSSYGVKAGTGQGIDALPDWIRKEPTWDIDEGVLGTRTATVNPAGVGEWLTAQCLKMGVKIQTDLKAIYASLSSEDKVQAIVCLNNDLTAAPIYCTKLLLACGPWTPIVYRTLFPSSPIDLQAATNGGDWIVCKNPCPTTEETVAYVSFQAIVGDKMEFAARNDGTIWACGQRNYTAPLPLPGQTAKPDEEIIESLLGRAHEWLNTGCSCKEKHPDKLQLVRKGRAFRPATKSGLPVISEVTTLELTGGIDHTSQTPNPSSGVFVCWGHGSYGLTLGMGTGKLMSQLMSGKKPDLDLSLFSLSRDGHATKNPARFEGSQMKL